MSYWIDEDLSQQEDGDEYVQKCKDSWGKLKDFARIDSFVPTLVIAVSTTSPRWHFPRTSKRKKGSNMDRRKLWTHLCADTAQLLSSASRQLTSRLGGYRAGIPLGYMYGARFVDFCYIWRKRTDHIATTSGKSSEDS